MRILVLFISLLFATKVRSAVVTPASGSKADMQAAHDLVTTVDGDIIDYPVGTNEYSSTLNITKAVTIRGQGTNSSTIKDNAPSSGPWGVQACIGIATKAGKTTRITGISFVTGTRATDTQVAPIYTTGLNTNGGRAVVDHCKFDKTRSRAHIFIYGAIGVSHHNTHLLSGSHFAFDIRHPNWNGKSNADGAFNDSAHFGTDQFWFIEDSVMSRTGGIFEYVDTYGGGRWVTRYCSILNGRVACHGTDSTGRERGTRAIEFYNNTMTGDGVNSSAISLRSGVALVWSNTITGWNPAFPSSVFGLFAYRMQASITFWTGAAATNIWDNNDPVGVYETGVATGGSTTTTRVFTDSSKAWTDNQWYGYTLRNLTRGRFSEISANTPTTITYKLDIYENQKNNNMVFSVGDSYEIRKVLNVIDQPGVGAGDLINVSSPAWPNQVVEPCYEWNNTLNTSLNAGMLGQNSVIVANTHYFNDTPMPGYTPYTYPHPLSGAGVSDVTIAAVDASAGEPGSGFGTGQFAFTRTGDTSTNLVINYTTTGTATGGGVDYTPTSATTMTILAGNTSATNTITVVDDPTVEPSETVIVTLGSGGYTVGSPSAATVTIFDDDSAAATVTVAATDATAGEPGTGDGGGVFTFTRTGPTDTNLVVNFSIAGSTATSSSDFTSIGTSVIIPSASSSVTVPVSIVDDSIAEDIEYIQVTVVTNFAAYLVALTNTATIQINDDDTHVSVSATDAFAGEPLSGFGTGTFTFTRTGPTSSPLTVNFSLLGATTALSGTDFESIGTSVTFGVGSSSETKTITVIDDPDYEGDQIVSLAIQESSEYLIDTPGATVTIFDDDILPVVQFIGSPILH